MELIISLGPGRCRLELSLVVSGDWDGGLDAEVGETGTSSEILALAAADDRGVEPAIADTDNTSPDKLAVRTDSGPRGSPVLRLRRMLDRLSGGG